jgi:hypothetical protein
LIVGQAACRSAPVAAAQRLGFACSEVDDPYEAMAQLCRRPLFFTAMILSLNSLYREELQVIATIKRRYSHIEIWLSDTDGRQAALAEAMRLGADGLLAEDGLHRIGPGTPPPEIAQPETKPAPAPKPVEPAEANERAVIDRASEPILTAEELRALLQEHPAMPANED